MTVAEAEEVPYYDPTDGQTKSVQAQVLDGAPEDTDLYAWVPGADQTVTVGGETKEYTFEDGKFTCKADYAWEAGVWSWSGDNARANCTVPCTDTTKAPLTWTVRTDVTAETKPTCEQAGSRTYTATVTALGRPSRLQRP